MTPEAWQTVKQRLAEALALEGEARRAFVESIDEPLRSEVRSLLDSDARRSGELEQGAVPRLPGPEAWIGRRLGAYELTGLLGEGGMGVVFLARRADGAFERDVAVKVLHRSLLAQQFLERFQVERQILARLEHPAIARLLDGGQTEEGDPYLVMERVEGVPIDRHCTVHALPLAARIDLFRQVCAAVQYAHANLVVHRDLKPGNILVGADGRPKLLDFGIAHRLDEQGPQATRLYGLQVMTLEYASPEQVRGERATVASDVYSLGVILHVLLTGRRPYRTRDATSLELVRAITGGDLLRPGLGGDLDAILLKAMRLEPGGRYETAERFGDDLRRCVEGLPVAARRGSRGYVLRRFLRRHALGAGLAAVALLVLVGALVAISALNLRLRAASRETASALAESRAVADFLEQDMLGAADPRESERTDLPVREVLASASRRVDARFAGQPLLAAAVHRALGQSWAGTGNLGMADADYQAALGLLEGRTDARSRALRLETVDAMATDHYNVEDYETAARLLGTVMPFRDAPASEDERDQRLLARATAGGLKVHQGDVEAGLAEIDAVVAEARALKGARDPVTLQARSTLAANLADAGLLERGERELRSLAADAKDDETGAISAIGIRDKLSALLAMRGKPLEAIAIAEPQYAEEVRLFGPGDPATITEGNVLAMAYDNSGQSAKAEALYRQLVANGERSLGAGSSKVQAIRGNLATLYQGQGRCADAIAIERTVLAALERTGKGESRSAIVSRRNIARCLLLQGRWAEAGTATRAVVALARARLARDDVLHSVLAVDLAQVQLHAGRRDEAARLLEGAIPVLQAELGPGHAVTKRALELRHQAGPQPGPTGG